MTNAIDNWAPSKLTHDYIFSLNTTKKLNLKKKSAKFFFFHRDKKKTFEFDHKELGKHEGFHP